MISLLQLILTIGICFSFLATLAPQNNSSKVALPVAVFDKKGIVPEGLKLENFRVHVDGQSAQITSAKPSLAARRIVLLIDVSGSMRDAPGQTLKRKNTWAAARIAARILENQHEIAVVTFGEKVEALSGFLKTFAEVDSILAKVMESKPWGKTSLLDAISEAQKMLAPAEFGDAVVAVTDGYENASHVRFKEVRDALLGGGVRFFALLVDDYNPLLQTREDRLAPLRTLAEDSGGTVIGPLVREYSSDEWFAVLRRLLNPLHAVYKLEIEIPPLPRKSGKWNVEVVRDNGKKWKGLTVAYPRHLSSFESEKN